MIMIKKNKKAWMIVTKVFFPHKLSFFPHPGYNEDFQDDLNLVKMCENLKQSKWSAQYFSYYSFLLLPLPLLPSEKVGPVEEVEDGEDAGEENPGENVDLLRRELEVGEPGGYSVRRNSEKEEHQNL